jgi:hypothetical protein
MNNFDINDLTLEYKSLALESLLFPVSFEKGERLIELSQQLDEFQSPDLRSNRLYDLIEELNVEASILSEIGLRPPLFLFEGISSYLPDKEREDFDSPLEEDPLCFLVSGKFVDDEPIEFSFDEPDDDPDLTTGDLDDEIFTFRSDDEDAG